MTRPKFSNKTETELLSYKSPKQSGFLCRLIGRVFYVSKYHKKGGW